MEIRLNKFISESGLCSRREADKFIETGRVTVNGQLPQIGQKVTEHDIVMLDDIRIQINKHQQEQARLTAGKTKELIIGNILEKKITSKQPPTKLVNTTERNDGTKPAGSKGLRPGKYIKYNKYAAARKAAKGAEKEDTESKLLREAMQPKFGKSLGRSAVAQRLGASAKSAALRKTSKNNPVNKMKRNTGHNKQKGE